MTSGSAEFIHFAAASRYKGLLVAAMAACGVALLPALVSVAVAEPLPKERCVELAAELKLLEGGGAVENIERGPDWAKANLTPEQINYIRRLIVVREDLQFRCRSFELAVDETPPSAAPADAPLPERKPAAMRTEKPEQNMPPPARPERAQKKSSDQNAGDDKTGQAAPSRARNVGAVKPELRGTLSATQKETSAATPAPQRKAKPVLEPAAKN